MDKIYELFEIIAFEEPISLAAFSTREKAEAAKKKIKKVSPGSYAINELELDPKEIKYSDGVRSVRIVFEEDK